MSEQAADLGWDDTTRPVLTEDGDAYPPGTAAAADHLVEVHDMLRSELDQLRDLIGKVRAGQLSAEDARSGIHTMTLRHNNWTLGAYCASYCRIVNGHHSLEDSGIFPHLKRSEPGVAPVVDRLQEEHEVIHVVLDRLDAALVALVSGADDDALDHLQGTVDLLATTLLSHLSYEERALRGPLARHGFY